MKPPAWRHGGHGTRHWAWSKLRPGAGTAPDACHAPCSRTHADSAASQLAASASTVSPRASTAAMRTLRGGRSVARAMRPGARRTQDRRCMGVSSIPMPQGPMRGSQILHRRGARHAQAGNTREAGGHPDALRCLNWRRHQNARSNARVMTLGDCAGSLQSPVTVIQISPTTATAPPAWPTSSVGTC